MCRLGFPLFLDTLGTIAVAAINGFLFPGIVTAVATNVICALFYAPSIYLSFFNAVIAICTVIFLRFGCFKSFVRTFLFVVITALISALSVTFVQYRFSEEAGLIAESAHTFATAASIPYLLSLALANFLLYLLEKGFISVFIIVLLTVAPKNFLDLFEEECWRRYIYSSTAADGINSARSDIKKPLHTRIAANFVVTSLVFIVLTSVIAFRLYFNNAKKEKTENALTCVKIASSFINPDKVDDFIRRGRNAPGYKDAENLLYDAWLASSVTYLYVIQNESDGARFVFDIVGEGSSKKWVQPGTLVPYGKEIEPFVSDLLQGKEFSPVETKSDFGWLLSVCKPIFDNSGKCVCYVVADVSLDYISSHMGSFVIKILLIMAGFFIVIISYEIWTTGLTTSYPISALAACLDRFADSDEDLETLEANVRFIRSLNIQSGDEIQKLYDALCRMTLSQSEQIRDIRRLSESTLKMQDGLIVTMADMVENRDSDTGAHIQKTAAYVKIIVEGLKAKGYYAQKITPKFISDIVRSAPLHDVGKINIPDNVLNKPGKLTDEEFAVMKTHTTAGKIILEKAISTVQGENYLKEARNMAAYHHERWDGKGYPEGRHGEVIPLSARIMAVADVFDALTSPRVYKPAFPIEKALAILQEGNGTQFDPKCVEVFMDALPEVQRILKKYNQPRGL